MELKWKWNDLFWFFSVQLLQKHTLNPEITLLYQFHAQKALFKVPKICNINFWIENDPPPPFGTLPNIHPIWRSHPSLSSPLWTKHSVSDMITITSTGAVTHSDLDLVTSHHLDLSRYLTLHQFRILSFKDVFSWAFQLPCLFSVNLKTNCSHKSQFFLFCFGRKNSTKHLANPPSPSVPLPFWEPKDIWSLL